MHSKKVTLDSVYQALARATGDEQVTEISADANLVADIGLDSLEIATFLIAVEEEFGITLPDSIENSPLSIRLVAEEILRLSSESS